MHKRENTEHWHNCPECSKQERDNEKCSIEPDLGLKEGLPFGYHSACSICQTRRRKHTILCDMDDVLADLNQGWIDRINKTYNTKITKEDITEWDLGDCIPTEFPEATCSRIYELLDKPGLFRNLKPLPGAKKALQRMKDLNWRVVIVTSPPGRPKTTGQAIQEKFEWIDHHLKGLISKRDIIVVHDKSLVVGDVLIDDGPHNIERYPGNTIIFNRPCNQHVQATRRVFNWDEMVDTCLDIFKTKHGL